MAVKKIPPSAGNQFLEGRPPDDVLAPREAKIRKLAKMAEMSILQIRILNMKNSGLEMRINLNWYFGSEDWCKKG